MNTKSTDRFSKAFMPYNLALDLEDHFGQFETETFYSVVDTIATGTGINSQQKIRNLFKTLSKDEVIRRSQIVSRFSKILLNIQIKSKVSNDNISSSLPTNTR